MSDCSDILCPCGSGQMLGDCCGVCFEAHSASDPEVLMRSRYTAFVLGRHDYLLATWHASTRPAGKDPGGTRLRWIGLEIERSARDGMAGVVEFIASYVDRGKGRRLHERSRFVCEGGRWLYVDGDCVVDDIGRNDACPCGSGRKFKRCCAERT